MALGKSLIQVGNGTIRPRQPGDNAIRASTIKGAASFTLKAADFAAGDLVLAGGTTVTITLDTALNIVNDLAQAGVILSPGDTISLDVYNGNSGTTTYAVATGVTANATLGTLNNHVANSKRTVYLTVTSTTVSTAYGTGANSGLAPSLVANYFTAAALTLLIA